MNDENELGKCEGPEPRPGLPARKPDEAPRRSRGLWITVAVIAVILAAGIFAGIRSRSSAEANLASSASAGAIMDVEVTHPQANAGPLDLVLPADTQGFIDTPIYARVSGYVLHWYTDIGAYVHTGEVLAVIAAPELDQQVQQAAGQVSTARANLQIARITARRWENLSKENAVSRQETDQAASNLSASAASLTAAEASLRQLKAMQSFETVRAPFNGVITKRNVDVGSLIQAGDSGATQAELFHEASIDRLRLFVPVPEIYARDVKVRERVKVTADAYPNQNFEGAVVRSASAINLATRTLNVEVDVRNADHKLLPGQYTFVHLPLPSTSGGLSLPANVLIFQAQGLRVGVVRNGHVHLVPITIGRDYGATVEVISGLSPEDNVVLNPSDSLSEGESVRIVNASARPGAGA